MLKHIRFFTFSFTLATGAFWAVMLNDPRSSEALTASARMVSLGEIEGWHGAAKQEPRPTAGTFSFSNIKAIGNLLPSAGTDPF